MARVGLSASARSVLQLLALCPDLPADVVAVLTGDRHPVSIQQLLRRLEQASFVRVRQVSISPILGFRRAALWSLTTAGTAQLLIEDHDVAAKYGASLQPPPSVRLSRPSLRLASAWMLTALVAERNQRGDRPVTASLQSPWRRTFSVNGSGRLRHVTLPAAVAVARQRSHPDDAGEVLVFLIPDLGTAPVHGYRSMVDELFLAAGYMGLAGSRLFVATPDLDGSNARVEAWRELIHRARARHGICLEPMVLRWSQVAERAPRLPRLARYAAVLGPTNAHFQIDHTFSLVSRHPYLMREQLAILLGSRNAHIASIVRELSTRGWVRAVQVRTINCEGHDLHSGERALLELTSDGWRVALGRSLLQTRRAVRHQGLSDDRVRRQLFRYLSHTVGANSVFVALVHAARVVNERGGDEALEEWRSAAGCARGRFRPDGYGCYRRVRTRHGFFLEYDRGTERSREYAAKLASYYSYRRQGGWRHEFKSFPVVLVVSNSERAEGRFAEAADRLAERSVERPLHILLTTVGRIENDAEGILGPIWRTPSDVDGAPTPRRSYWLAGGPAKGLYGRGRRLGSMPQLDWPELSPAVTVGQSEDHI